MRIANTVSSTENAMTLRANRILPSSDLLNRLAPAYEPCAGLAGGCRNKVSWAPARGHVPRGYCGAIGGLAEVRLVLVMAEPGDPHHSESHMDDGSSRGRQESAARYAWEAFETGKDLFHRRVRELLDACWPGADFNTQMRWTWITDSVLCSASKEGGSVPISVVRECGARYLHVQLAMFPNALVAALGNKAKDRLRSCGVSEFFAAGAIAPPGCNFPANRASHERLAAVVRAKFPV